VPRISSKCLNKIDAATFCSFTLVIRIFHIRWKSNFVRKSSYFFTRGYIYFRRQGEYVTYYSALFTSISNAGHVTIIRTLKASCRYTLSKLEQSTTKRCLSNDWTLRQLSFGSSFQIALLKVTSKSLKISPVKTKDKWRTGKHKYRELLSVFKNYLKRSDLLFTDWFNWHQIKVFYSYLFYAFSIFPEINNDFPRKQVWYVGLNKADVMCLLWGRK
jgi:hypothetical protein